MKKQEPLQKLIDPFVESSGGELVADILGDAPNLPESADYLFRAAGVIAELKSLENATFGESYHKKMSGLVESWADRGLVLIYGTQRVDLDQLPPTCQEDVLRLIAQPLRTNIFRKANRQIRETKESLELPATTGLLLIASDGNEDLRPSDVPFFFSRLLYERNPDGTLRFPNIDALVYFNPRMPAELPTTGQLALIWGTMLRQPQDSKMLGFLSVLGEAFRVYMEKKMGVAFPKVELEETHQHSLGFAGIPQQIPEIR
jgi:hypothetical protein